jgi:hypothetical protein
LDEEDVNGEMGFVSTRQEVDYWGQRFVRETTEAYERGGWAVPEMEFLDLERWLNHSLTCDD